MSNDELIYKSLTITIICDRLTLNNGFDFASNSYKPELSFEVLREAIRNLDGNVTKEKSNLIEYLRTYGKKNGNK